MATSIIGWAHTPFGKLEDETIESLIRTVSRDAIGHAGLSAEVIDGVFVGLYNNGFSQQDFPSSLPMQEFPELRFKPATRVENACATGSAAIHGAIDWIEAGRGRVALVVGVEKMTARSGKQIGDILLSASYVDEEAAVDGGFAGVFAEITKAYWQRYGDPTDALAMIAAKNHRNGVDNPYAQLRKDLGFEFCNTVSDKNPYVAQPLRRTDCSLVSDGAAALVIADTDSALAAERAIAFRSTAHVNDYLPLSRRDRTRFDGAAEAWRQALGRAHLAVDDLSFVETHDCFTIAELIEYEAMGLAEPGQGRRVIEEGVTAKDGRLPVNPSGGLKSKGHPIGATGVSMHALAAMQLTDSAGDMQVKGADLAGVFNMGGSAVANYVSVLERIK